MLSVTKSYIFINSIIKSCLTECLASLADNIDPEHFRPLAVNSLRMGMELLDKADDPDVKKSLYSLFASLSGVIKEEMAFALPKIIECMLDTVQNTDGIIVKFFFWR